MLSANLMKHKQESINILVKLEEFYDSFIKSNADYLMEIGKIEDYLDTRDDLLFKINRLKRNYGFKVQLNDISNCLLYNIHINSNSYDDNLSNKYNIHLKFYEELIKKINNIENDLLFIKTELISIKKN